MDTTPKPDPKPRSLAAKMAAAMGEIGRVSKRGKNQAQGYSYARADDVAEQTREVLAKHGIAVFADVIESGLREIETKSGKQRVSTVRIAWTFEDGETGESRTVHTPGEGMDSGDKGIYKAMTGAMKYALMIGFLIPTGDADPENDAEERRPTGKGDTSAAAVRAAAARQVGNARPVPTTPEARKDDLKARLKAMGVPGAKMAEQLGEWIGRVVDKDTVFTADDWSKADAGIEMAKQAAGAIGRAQDNGAASAH